MKRWEEKATDLITTILGEEAMPCGEIYERILSHPECPRMVKQRLTLRKTSTLLSRYFQDVGRVASNRHKQQYRKVILWGVAG